MVGVADHTYLCVYVSPVLCVPMSSVLCVPMSCPTCPRVLCPLSHVSPVLLAEPMFNLTMYLNTPSLSDVVLISDDGKKFFAHRIVMCVQSQVFKTMLDSDLWAESHNKEVPSTPHYIRAMFDLCPCADALPHNEWACLAVHASVSVHRGVSVPPR